MNYRKIFLPMVIIFLVVAFLELPKIFTHKDPGKKDQMAIGDGISISSQVFFIDAADAVAKFVTINSNAIPIEISTPQVLEEKIGKPDYTGYTLKEYAEKGDYRIVQSGGFLSSWSPPRPLGYVKANNKEFNKVHDSWLTQGVFCTRKKEFKIEKYYSLSQFENWGNCLQAGPMIIQNHKIVLNTNRNTWFVTSDPHRQSFLCKNDNQQLIMGMIDNVKLTSFAPILTLPVAKGGLGCSDAVALTGKGIAGIYINMPNNLISIGNVDVPLPNVIVVK
jgi:hypothetical protein